MRVVTGHTRAGLGRHQPLMKEGIPMRQTYNVGARSRIRNEGSGRSGRQRTIQSVGCTFYIGPHSVAGQHCKSHHIKRPTAATKHGTAGIVTKRHQRSTGNACAPRPTVYDESCANATTAGTWTRWTKWRTRQWTWPKQ